MSDKKKILNDCSVEDLVRALLKKTANYAESRNENIYVTREMIVKVLSILDESDTGYADYKNPESYSGGKDQPHHTRI